MFVAPTETSNAKVADVANALILVSPSEQKIGVVTDFGTSDPIIATIVNLETNEVFPDMTIWNDQLIRAFKSIIGMQTIGKIVKGVSKTPGHTAPWIFKSEVDVPASVAVATAYLAKATTPPDFTAKPAAVAATEAAVLKMDGITPEVAALLAQLGTKVSA